MTEDVIELYDNFNNKGYTDELIFGNFNDQPIPSDYYDFLNDDYIRTIKFMELLSTMPFWKTKK